MKLMDLYPALLVLEFKGSVLNFAMNFLGLGTQPGKSSNGIELLLIPKYLVRISSKLLEISQFNTGG
jgi:hypothetical protein